jgi:hypothetical protein
MLSHIALQRAWEGLARLVDSRVGSGLRFA